MSQREAALKAWQTIGIDRMIESMFDTWWEVNGDNYFATPPPPLKDVAQAAWRAACKLKAGGAISVRIEQLETALNDMLELVAETGVYGLAPMDDVVEKKITSARRLLKKKAKK